MNCRRSIIIADLWRSEVARRWKKSISRFFGKGPFTGQFSKFCSIEFIASPIDVFCSNFVKFGRRKIGKVVRCLPDKKFAWLSSSRYCADRAQNLPGPAADNVLRVLQISCESVHCRRSYTRTSEHHQNGPFPIFGWSLASSRIINKCFHKSQPCSWWLTTKLVIQRV